MLEKRGDPREVLDAYRASIAEKVREWGATLSSPLRPAMRRGDGRAEILSLETLGADGNPTAVWRSGENATVRVTVRYHDAVEEPVIGIMIRTRIGLEVYGTNTELEKVSTGSCAAGCRMRIEFGVPLRAVPGRLHHHSGFARRRRHGARLAGRRSGVRGGGFTLHRRRGESAGQGEDRYRTATVRERRGTLPGGARSQRAVFALVRTS